jgi:ribonuclease III
VAALAARLDYEFGNPALLRLSMCHRSWVSETTGEDSNERLEFLGDAVLGWIVADIAYRHYVDDPEGRLTDVRKAVVNASALAEVAESIELGEHLLLGRGEDATGGRHKASILSDALEAVIGAVYLDGGAVAATGLIERLLGERIRRAAGELDHLDHKTMLQELSTRVLGSAPSYRLSETGPEHAKHFTAVVIVAGEEYGNGEGRSKKQAEQVAARAACARLRELASQAHA